ncbi:MAG: ATP-binding protein [Planctomycetaceae bacterium]
MAIQKKHEGKSDADDRGSEFLIEAMPTKELFIDMMTRDIALIPAIIDLVDNSADGARKLKGEGSLNGLWARVTISPEKFVIADNCGGISVDTARNYAFRFGRPPGAPSVKHSVGQFGVGMKRAIFKMGRKFCVESTTASSRFVVDVDVNKWAQLPEWKFHFAELDEVGTYKGDNLGTTISVTSLQSDVAEVFELLSFEIELRSELKAALQDPIARGLAVTLNGIPVNAEPMTMLSDELAPAYKQLIYKKMGKPVTVKLYCGLGRSSSRQEERAEAGWHVFCNGRLILEGDKSPVTGWGEELDQVSIPGFHGQYNHLRGFAYFDSDDPARLPWNTTKTGLNTDSPVYRAVKLEMMTLMRPVVDFLNRLKEEKQGKQDADEKGPLESILEAATPTPVATVSTRTLFAIPSVKSKTKPSGPTMQKIQYEAPLDEVLAVKKAIKATSFKEVGERTFKYFYNAEVDE